MDILEMLKKHGIEVPEDKLEGFNKDFRVSYKSTGEVNKIKESLKNAEATIQGYTSNDYESKLKALQEKYDTDIAAKQKELDTMIYTTKLNKALEGIEFSSERNKNSVLDEIRQKNFKVNDKGQLDGLNDYLKDLYKNEPAVFKNVDNTIHTWAGGSDNKNSPQVKDYSNLFGRII